MEYLVKNTDDMGSLAKEILEYPGAETPAIQARILALSGDLGAGKTTFAQSLAKALGVTESIKSPTFVIRKSYATNHPVWKKLVHIDAYRLNDEGELRALRFEDDVTDPATIIAIEWPEQIPKTLSKYICEYIKFEHVDETTRRISVIA